MIKWCEKRESSVVIHITESGIFVGAAATAQQLMNKFANFVNEINNDDVIGKQINK